MSWTRFGSAAFALGLLGVVATVAIAQSLSEEQLTDLRRGPRQLLIEGRETCAPVVGRNDLPLINTMVNGKGPFPLLLDFGSNVVLLRDDVARTAGVRFEIVRPGTDIARAESMSFGGLQARDVLIGVDDELDVAGVLSFHFFRDHAVRLDFPGHRICVFDGPRPMEVGGNVLTLKVSHRIPYIDVQIADRTVPMFLDTGAYNWMSFPESYSASLPLQGTPVPGPTVTNNQTGNTRVQLARLSEDMVIGPIRIDHPEVFFDTATDDPFLGQSLLQRYVITVDSASRTIRFDGDLAEPVSVPDYTSFGIALGFGSDGVRVVDRVPGSHAERLVPANARVLRLNGVPAKDLTRLKWRDFRLDATELDIELESHGTRRNVKLEREPLLKSAGH